MLVEVKPYTHTSSSSDTAPSPGYTTPHLNEVQERQERKAGDSKRKRDGPAHQFVFLRGSEGSKPTVRETAGEPRRAAMSQEGCARTSWSDERGAWDAVLPHGASWSMRQIEWFVSTWWRHLASASSATKFETSLAHFSAWASEMHGLECLIAWLPKTVELREDLVTLQVLELLEYAELTFHVLKAIEGAELQLISHLHRLIELVLGIQKHEDKQVAETAERVAPILEGLLPVGNTSLDA
jgi:hypothetical protein